MASGPSLAELRVHLLPAREIEARERRERLSTGTAVLDGLLGGGWPRGALSEVRGGRGQGRTAVMLASLSATLRAGHAAALIDFGATFDPGAAVRVGLPLERLLWVRPPAAGSSAARAPCPADRHLRQLLAAAETIAKAGGFGLLALDFGERTPAVPTASWLRLRRLAAAPGTAVLVVTPRPLGNLFGATSLCLEAAAPRFYAPGPRGSARPPALLAGIEVEARVSRQDVATDAPRLTLIHCPA